MSITSTRDDIAAALATVGGVNGFPRRPRAPRPGDAWPLFQGSERDDDTGLWSHKFTIGVMLPQDEAAADAWIDEHFESVAQAIEQAGVGWVDQCDPANLGTETSPVYGLVINMRSD